LVHKSLPYLIVSPIFYTDQIKQDFEVKVLRDQLKVKTVNSELEASQAKRTQLVKQQVAAMEQHYVAKFKAVDQQADALNAKFSDLFHQLDYDADQLLKTHQQKQTSEKKELCVETRTGLTTCFKEGKGECDYWIKALENCVRDRVLEK
jgi:transketolase